MRTPGAGQHRQHPIFERSVQNVTGQTRVAGFVRGTLIPRVRRADEQRQNFAVITIDHVLGFGRGDADGLWLGPRAALPPLTEEHADHGAPSCERLADVDRVDDLAVRKPGEGHGAFGRRHVLPEFVEEALPRRCLDGGGPDAGTGVTDFGLLEHVSGARPVLGVEDRIVTNRAVAAKELPILGLEQRRPDVFADLRAIGVIRALARPGEPVPVANELDPVIASAADNGVRDPLGAGDVDDAARAEVLKPFCTGSDVDERCERLGEHSGGTPDYSPFWRSPFVRTLTPVSAARGRPPRPAEPVLRTASGRR